MKHDISRVVSRRVFCTILLCLFSIPAAVLGLVSPIPAARAAMLPPIPKPGMPSLAPSFLVVVTTTDDSGVGSLREAISLAPSGSVINFAVTGTITLASFLPNVTQNPLAIIGPTGGITISGGNLRRVFSVNPGANLSLENLTIANGKADGGFGGGVYNDDGTLNVTNSTFISNGASVGGGISNGSGGTVNVTNSTFSSNNAQVGGSIFNGGTLNVTNSTFSNANGQSGSTGGGIHNDSGGATNITNSTFSNNHATAAGGIYNAVGTLNLINSTFSGNSATIGGGIFSQGSLTVIGSTFSGNSASNTGGGIYNSGGGTLNVTNSTLYANTANIQGGGINSGATSNITNSTLFSNTAGTSGGGIQINSPTTLRNTIVANSTNGNCSSSAIDGGNNLESANDCGLTASSSITNTNPALGPLANNGGATLTMALLAGSFAIDKGNDATCPATDQRGVTRPIGAHCDIGAFEAPVYIFYVFPFVTK